MGNSAWSYDKVLPVFRDLESNAAIHDEFHGDSGPLKVSTRGFRHPLSQAFVAAAIEAVYCWNRPLAHHRSSTG